MNEPTTPSRVWLITGCSSGFGRALATAALARGQWVVATARRLESIAPLAERHPETCRAITLDVTDSAQVKSAVAEAAAAFGRIDVVVNNAGYGLIGAFEELGEEQIARNFSVNFFGALEVIRATLPILRAQGDPARAAEAIIAAVESDTPPSRLVLGKYANDKARKKFTDAEKERAAWEHVGVPTDFTPTP